VYPRENPGYAYVSPVLYTDIKALFTPGAPSGGSGQLCIAQNKDGYTLQACVDEAPWDNMDQVWITLRA